MGGAWIGGSHIFGPTDYSACASADDHPRENCLPDRPCDNRQTIIARTLSDYGSAFCSQRLAWQWAMSLLKEAEPDREIDTSLEDLVGRWNDEE